MPTMFFDGVPTQVNNIISKEDDTFYVSYNPIMADYGVDTTALYIRETAQFLILAGDHREGYTNLDFQQSIDYFYANINKAVVQSEHGKIFKFADGKAEYIQGGY